MSIIAHDLILSVQTMTSGGWDWLCETRSQVYETFRSTLAEIKKFEEKRPDAWDRATLQHQYNRHYAMIHECPATEPLFADSNNHYGLPPYLVAEWKEIASDFDKHLSVWKLPLAATT